jgi:hypothetical protein
MSHNPPPAPEAEDAAARKARLQADHESFLRSVATSRSMKKIQSTIAGAGGTTWTDYRMSQRKETTRLDRIDAAEGGAERQQQFDAVAAGRQADADASKARRLAKRGKQKARKAGGAEEAEMGDAEEGVGAPPADGGEERQQQPVRRLESSGGDAVATAAAAQAVTDADAEKQNN